MPKKRGPYKRRFCTPLFPKLKAKTTSPEGRRAYDMYYKRLVRGSALLSEVDVRTGR